VSDEKLRENEHVISTIYFWQGERANLPPLSNFSIRSGRKLKCIWVGCHTNFSKRFISSWWRHWHSWFWVKNITFFDISAYFNEVVPTKLKIEAP